MPPDIERKYENKIVKPNDINNKPNKAPVNLIIITITNKTFTLSTLR